MGDFTELKAKVQDTSLNKPETDGDGELEREAENENARQTIKYERSSTEDSDNSIEPDSSSDDTLNEKMLALSANFKDNRVGKSNNNERAATNSCTNDVAIVNGARDTVESSNSCSTSNPIVRGNSSLCNLLVYGSDESSDSESSSDSDSYESLGLSDNEDECAAKSVEFAKKKNVRATARTLGELSIDDLPPVPDLTQSDINVTENECIHMGSVTAIIDRLVTVDSLPNIPAYDLDTLLFLENGKKPLGYVYDVMGPVAHPVYVIRFNSREEIDSLDIKKGLPVFSAPKSQHTQYVFLDKLMQNKGSDASWTGDNEVPTELAEFSDDEEERKYRRGGGGKTGGDTRKRNSIEKHREFEKDMNVKNIIDSRLHKIRDSFEPTSKKHAPNLAAAAAAAAASKTPGFQFQPNSATVAPAVFNFAHPPPPVNPNVPSFNPFVTAPFVQIPQYPIGPYMAPMLRALPPMQNVAPFMPSVPPPPLPHAMRPPSMPMAPPPNVEQKHRGLAPRVLYPAEMGLPRPRGSFVPFYNPGVANVWSYQHSVPPPSHQVRPPRGYFPRNSWT